jgi:hypothetical protein
MAFTLTVMVGLPTLIGKFVLSTDFIRASGDGFLTTIRSISFVSDCLLRGAVMILKELLAFPRLVARPATDYIMGALNVTSIDISQALNYTTSVFSHTIVAPEAVLPINYSSEGDVVAAVMDGAIDGLELMGKTAYNCYKAFRLVSISIAASPDSSDTFLSLVVGYATLSLAVVCIAIIDAANLLQLSPSFMEKARTVQTFLKVRHFCQLHS